MSENMKIALISSITAIIVAFLTGYFSVILTIRSQEKAVAEISQKIQDLEKRAEDFDKMNNLPVGSVVSSLLDPEQFREAVGDPENHNILIASALWQMIKAVFPERNIRH